MDDRPSGGQPARPVGRPPANFDLLRRDEFIDLIAEGKGIDQALRLVGQSSRAYRNLVAKDPDFREEVDSARRAADQLLDEVGHLLAQSNPDVLLEVWKRRDQARLMRDARTDRRSERAEEREDRLARESQERADRLAKEEADRAERDKDRAVRIHLARMAAEARVRELMVKAGDGKSKEGELDLRGLTSEELAQLEAIYQKIAPKESPD